MFLLTVGVLLPDLAVVDASAGPRVDGVCIGTRPPSLQALMKGSYTAAKLTIVTVGSAPPIAAFEVSPATTLL